jgi:hypothetical protein
MLLWSPSCPTAQKAPSIRLLFSALLLVMLLSALDQTIVSRAADHCRRAGRAG